MNVFIFFILSLKRVTFKRMWPAVVPWHVKLAYYSRCHCTNVTNCTEVKMCSFSMPKQGKKGSIVFGAEHLFTSHTYSYNHVISGCLYLTIQPFEQRRKSNSCIKDEPITVFTDCFLLSPCTNSLDLLCLWLSLPSKGEAITLLYLKSIDKAWINWSFG